MRLRPTRFTVVALAGVLLATGLSGAGRAATPGYLLTATGPQGKSFVDHGFAPGRHTVTMTATSAAGDTATWATQIVVFPPVPGGDAGRVHVEIVDGTGTVARA